MGRFFCTRNSDSHISDNCHECTNMTFILNNMGLHIELSSKQELRSSISALYWKFVVSVIQE